MYRDLTKSRTYKSVLKIFRIQNILSKEKLGVASQRIQVGRQWSLIKDLEHILLLLDYLNGHFTTIIEFCMLLW